MLRIMTIVGTRPDTIKMAPILYEFGAREQIASYLCSSGQHFEMLKQALDIFSLTPDIDLGVMTSSQTLSSLTSRLIPALSKTLLSVKPDIVVVHGDTTTAFCGALSAFYNEIPVVHVEAGLRTNQISEPFPEEFNRQAIARIADLNFCPTEHASLNLHNEGVEKVKIVVSGNSIVDSLRIMKFKIENDLAFISEINHEFAKLFDFSVFESNFILVTIHRRENIGGGIEEVCRALKRLAETFPDTNILIPVHLNPAVSKVINEELQDLSNIYLIPPQPYSRFVLLLMKCLFVISDSGGIQEECVSLGKQALVTRNKTERGEGIESGFLRIVSTDEDKIFKLASAMIINPTSEIKFGTNPYGEGEISKMIVDKILEKYHESFSRRS